MKRRDFFKWLGLTPLALTLEHPNVRMPTFRPGKWRWHSEVDVTMGEIAITDDDARIIRWVSPRVPAGMRVVFHVRDMEDSKRIEEVRALLLRLDHVSNGIPRDEVTQWIEDHCARKSRLAKTLP